MKPHPAMPPPVSRPWLLGAAMVWLITLLAGPRPVIPIPAGRYEGDVRLLGEVKEGRFGPWAFGEVDGGTVLVDFEAAPDAHRGDVLTVAGRLDGRPGQAAGRRYGSALQVRETSDVVPSGFLLHRAGRLVERRVTERLAPHDEGRALLAGFLIGDTSDVDPRDVEVMRRSGLSHFVAVSGSNVALFLGLLAAAAGPLALGPRRRAVLGLAALPIYMAATRFEPSVIRASVMAAIALTGRLAGVVLEAWQLLAVSVIAVLFADPGFASSVGFQLSVAATAGVLVGGRWPVGGKMSRALAVTTGAQISVAPLLLLHFGTVPLLSPIANLAAAPLVAASTTLGAIGVVGPGWLISPAAWLAGVILAIARGAAPWPQLDLPALAGIVSIGVALLRWPRLRPTAAVVACLALVLTLIGQVAPTPEGSVVVLDVGQGDAILIHGEGDRWALVDGGPDQLVLLDELVTYGVRSLELVVLTHVHADHATGLTGLVGRVPIGMVWEATQPHETPASRQFFTSLDGAGVPRAVPAPGDRWDLGPVDLIVEGPIRRYASPNDQSIVLTVVGPVRSMLLAGDIETHAQADLGHLRADVLKVPHQGAATSDPTWLRRVGARHAVVSVGPNDYGHPAEWVMSLLVESAIVERTDQVGDVVIDLTSPG